MKLNLKAFDGKLQSDNEKLLQWRSKLTGWHAKLQTENDELHFMQTEAEAQRKAEAEAKEECGPLCDVADHCSAELVVTFECKNRYVHVCVDG